MHEFSIVTGIVDSVLGYAEAHPELAIVKVRITVGELSCVDMEQLRFCYRSVITGLSIEKSELEVEIQRTIVWCRSCSYEGPPKYWETALADAALPTLQCPKCGNYAEAVQGHECGIKSLQVLQRDGAVGARTAVPE